MKVRALFYKYRSFDLAESDGDSRKFLTVNLRLFISLLDSLSVPYFSVIDETRFPVYVRALSCHLRIALLD